MIENKFITLSEEDALKFIELHLKEGFIISAGQNHTKPKIIRIGNGYEFCPMEYEYIIVATKEE